MAATFLAATLCFAAGPFSVLVAAEVDLPGAAAKQLSVECQDILEQDENDRQALHDLGILALHAQALIYEDPRGSLVAQLHILRSFISSHQVSVLHLCPATMMRHFKNAADAALAAKEVTRQRYLLQWSATFRLEVLSRWYTRLQSNPKWTKETLPVEAAIVINPDYFDTFDITLQSLHRLHGVKAKPLMRASEVGEVEVLAVCLYEDPRLPELASQNHGRYCARRGYRYRQLRKVPEGEDGWERLGRLPRQPHYWKILQTLDALERKDAPDWVLVIDCDAFFTNADVGVMDVALTYGPSAAFFVAEDPAGINSGVLLFRRHDWCIHFLRNVLESPFVQVWDQSQFFGELLKEYGTFEPEFAPAVPSHIAPVHQSHLNAYHQGTADEWHAYAWKPGDFIIHYAGCPWDETFCWDKMATSAHVIDDQLSRASEHYQTEPEREGSVPRGGSGPTRGYNTERN